MIVNIGSFYNQNNFDSITDLYYCIQNKFSK